MEVSGRRSAQKGAFLKNKHFKRRKHLIYIHLKDCITENNSKTFPSTKYVGAFYKNGLTY